MNFTDEFDVHGCVLCVVYFQLNYRDEVEHSLIQAMLLLNFKKIFTIYMVSTIKVTIRCNCEGCQLDLPSQLDHKCLEENVLG